jgi:hypothetical protein
MAQPIKIKIYYPISEKIYERGDYQIKSRKVQGHREYKYSSAVWLTWNLPKSKQNLIRALRQWTWRMGDIDYDHSKVDLDKRRQDAFADYDKDKKLLSVYDKFDGEENTIITRVENNSGPQKICIYFADGTEREVEISDQSEIIEILKEYIN